MKRFAPNGRLDSLLVNPDWAKLPLFERKGWKRLPFGEFAESVNERVEPTNAADEIYVGLDDLDSGNLHIRRWGKGSDVIGTKLRFRKGDIIFGRRRAYQRKLAVAEFDGICSAHAMVVRAKCDLVLPAFLPFLMISDRFMKRAMAISVGSLSPTINWTTLKLEEFDLPPAAQQRRVAELFMVLDEDKEVKLKAVAATQDLYVAEIEAKLDVFFHGKCERLDNLLTDSPEGGCSAPSSPIETGHYVLSLAALSRNGYLSGNLKSVLPTKVMLECRLRPGDLLISRSNTQELVGLVGIFDEKRDDVSFPDTMMRLNVDETRIDKRFLEAVLRSRRGRLHMMRSAAGTSGSMKKINRRTLGSCRIPVPALHVQEQLLAQMRRLERSLDLVRAAYKSNRALTRSLLEALFNKSVLTDE